MELNRAEEAQAVAAARAGEPDALAALYRAHAPAVMALAWRLTESRADAEDVLHDVFVGLPEALRHYRERGSFAAWLKRVAARTALMRLRRGRRRREVALDDQGTPSHRGGEDAIAARSDLWSAVRALPESLRTVFVLKEVEGHSHAEVGELLGITSGASEVRLCRAMRILRERLKGGAR